MELMLSDHKENVQSLLSNSTNALLSKG